MVHPSAVLKVLIRSSTKGTLASMSLIRGRIQLAVQAFVMVRMQEWPFSRARCVGLMIWKMTDTPRREDSYPVYSAAGHKPSLADLGWHAQAAFSFGILGKLCIQVCVFDD